MKWIKASDRLPELGKPESLANVTFRKKKKDIFYMYFSDNLFQHNDIITNDNGRTMRIIYPWYKKLWHAIINYNPNKYKVEVIKDE